MPVQRITSLPTGTDDRRRGNVRAGGGSSPKTRQNGGNTYSCLAHCGLRLPAGSTESIFTHCPHPCKAFGLAFPVPLQERPIVRGWERVRRTSSVRLLSAKGEPNNRGLRQAWKKCPAPSPEGEDAGHRRVGGRWAAAGDVRARKPWVPLEAGRCRTPADQGGRSACSSRAGPCQPVRQCSKAAGRSSSATASWC